MEKLKDRDRSKGLRSITLTARAHPAVRRRRSQRRRVSARCSRHISDTAKHHRADFKHNKHREPPVRPGRARAGDGGQATRHAGQTFGPIAAGNPRHTADVPTPWSENLPSVTPCPSATPVRP